MTWTRPTLAELVDKSVDDFDGRLPGADARLPVGVLPGLARAKAEGENELYGAIAFLADQLFDDTAEDEFLDRRGAEFGVFRKLPSFAGGPASIAGNAGMVVTAGTVVQRSDGVSYSVTADVAIGAGGAATLNLKAQDAGAAGNAAAGTKLQLQTGLAGVQNVAIVSAPGLTGGADVEDDDAYRARIIERKQNPPQAGAPPDYVRWAKEVPGVTRAWAVRNAGAGNTVTVYAMLDDANAAYGGFPQGTNGVAAGETRGTAATGDQLTVANYIFGGRQPITGLVYVCSPIANPQNFTIKGVPPALQAAVSTAIAEALNDGGSPGGTNYIDDIEAAIKAAAAGNHFLIVSPTVDIVNPAGRFPTLGVITWQYP